LKPYNSNEMTRPEEVRLKPYNSNEMTRPEEVRLKRATAMNEV
jgi:hypothetical protein